MKNHTLMSLSIQKEIKKQRLVVESEVNSSLNELNMRTILYRSNIRKQRGYSPVSLLFVMLLLPLSKINLTSLWTSDFYDRFINAGKGCLLQVSQSHPFQLEKVHLLDGQSHSCSK